MFEGAKPRAVHLERRVSVMIFLRVPENIDRCFFALLLISLGDAWPHGVYSGLEGCSSVLDILTVLH